VDQFISLVNPERPIQPFVVNLTGINNKMLRHAPKFYEVAKRIVEITESCVIVAHNAKFDYRILKTEFSRLGFEFERKNLCTVELSKTLIPDLPSYSLGKLVRSLGIPVSDRHRASGDAQATVKLFKLLLEKDSEKSIVSAAIRKEPKLQIEPKLVDIIAGLPSATGVYYIHNANGDIIYIGKSKNIKSRINQHFTGQNPKSKKIQLEVAHVTYDTTGSELVALLKESEEIKQNKPRLNRALRRSVFTHGLFSHLDETGYINLTIEKITGKTVPITTFSNYLSGKHFLTRVVENYNLCQKLNGLYQSKSSCFNYGIKVCQGACVNKEAVEDYNNRVVTLIESYSVNHSSYIVVDQGRAMDERSAVLVEKGIIKGYTFFNLNFQINTTEVLKSILTPLQHNKDAQHILQSYLRKHKRLKIFKLDD
jgi:DNA polymerase-3 subunit epsilon